MKAVKRVKLVKKPIVGFLHCLHFLD